MGESDHIHLFCHRCGAQLHPGEGAFYVVRMEAFADPTPPNLDVDYLSGEMDISAEIERLIDQMKELSEQELKDQVYRRLTIHLCGKCYSIWIENPAGG